MVMTVHTHHRLFKNRADARFPFDSDIVASGGHLPFGEIMVERTLQFIGYVNVETSPEPHIYELAAAADSQERLTIRDRSPEQFQFQFIPGGFHVIEGMVLLTAVA